MSKNLSSSSHKVVLISHASKIMLKIRQQQNQELPDVQAGFRKSTGIGHQIANIRWITEKTREFQKNIYFCFTDYAKAFNCVDHSQSVYSTNCENSERDGNTRPSYLPPVKRVCRSRSNAQNWTWNNHWFKTGKGERQGCILSPCLFNLHVEYII